MLDPEIKRLAQQELKQHNIPTWLTWNQAREWLHDGRMSQGAFDLFDDCWNTFTDRYSVQAYQIEASIRRLTERYS